MKGSKTEEKDWLTSRREDVKKKNTMTVKTNHELEEESFSSMGRSP